MVPHLLAAHKQRNVVPQLFAAYKHKHHGITAHLKLNRGSPWPIMTTLFTSGGGVAPRGRRGNSPKARRATMSCPTMLLLSKFFDSFWVPVRQKEQSREQPTCRNEAKHNLGTSPDKQPTSGQAAKSERVVNHKCHAVDRALTASQRLVTTNKYYAL